MNSPVRRSRTYRALRPPRPHHLHGRYGRDPEPRLDACPLNLKRYPKKTSPNAAAIGEVFRLGQECQKRSFIRLFSAGVFVGFSVRCFFYADNWPPIQKTMGRTHTDTWNSSRRRSIPQWLMAGIRRGKAHRQDRPDHRGQPFGKIFWCPCLRSPDSRDILRLFQPAASEGRAHGADRRRDPCRCRSGKNIEQTPGDEACEHAAYGRHAEGKALSLGGVVVGDDERDIGHDRRARTAHRTAPEETPRQRAAGCSGAAAIAAVLSAKKINENRARRRSSSGGKCARRTASSAPRAR